MATCHAQDLLNYMFDNAEQSDLVIVLPNKRIFVHKSILFSACPAFAARSKKAGNRSYLILDDDEAAVQSILHYIYGAEIPKIVDVEQCKEAVKLLVAAKRYQLGRLMRDLHQAIAAYMSNYLKHDVEGQVEFGSWLYQLNLLQHHLVIETMKGLVIEMIAENIMLMTSQAHEDKFAGVWAKLLESGQLMRDVMQYVARHSSVVAHLPSRCDSRKRADSGVEI